MKQISWWGLLFFLGWCPSLVGLAQGGLTVTPTRVIFEDGERTQSITLVNRSANEARYRLFFTEKRMNEQGTLLDAEKAFAGKTSKTMVRFTPRRVALKPGQSQKVRLLLRSDRVVEPGEYRSHLVIQAVPEIGAYQVNPSETNNHGVGIRLSALIGASIPIIVRQGVVSAAVSVVEARLDRDQKEKGPQLFVRFQREGSASVYGDVTVQRVQPEGDSNTIGYVKGMAIYSDVNSRTLTMPVQFEGTPNPGEYLLVRYTSAHPGEEVLAEFQCSLTD